MPAQPTPQLDLFERYFDHLLVHGDPALIAFGRTFGPAAKLGARLHYTGYVVDAAQPGASASKATDAGRDEVVVSAGGGADASAR